MYPGPCPPVQHPTGGGDGGGGYLGPYQLPVKKTALEKYQLRRLTEIHARHRERVLRDDREVMELLATVLQSGILE